MGHISKGEKVKALRNELELMRKKCPDLDFKKAFVLMDEIDDDVKPLNPMIEFVELEQSLHFIIDKIPYRLFWKDTSLCVLGSNKVYKNRIEEGGEEQILQNGIKEEGEKFDKEIVEGKRKSATFRFFYTNSKNDKSVFKIEKIALLNKQNAVVGILETQIDLSYQYRLKDKLFEVNRLLFSVLNKIPYAVFWKDKDFKFKYANKRFLDVVGCKSIMEIVGKTGSEMFWKEGSGEFLSEDLVIKRTKRPILNREEFMTKADGAKIWLKINKAPVLNEKDEFDGIIGVLDDITESFGTRIALRHSEARLKNYFDCSTDGIVVLNGNLEIRDVNMAVESIFAQEPDYFQEKNLFDLFVDDDHLLAFKVKCLQMDIESVSGQCVANDGKCGLKYLNLDLIYIELDHYICLIKDVTELQLAIKKAEESNRLKTAFLQNISHEIRTPLNAIIGFSNLLLLKMYENESEAENFTQIIFSNSEYLLGLINSVIDLSKIEADQISLKVEKITLFPFLQKEILPVIVSERDRFNKKGVDVKVVFEDTDLDLTMVVDVYRLKQIIVNLMYNAIKFTEQGKVHLLVKHENDLIRFVVVDTGIGIQKGELDKIFHRFYKVSDSNLTRTNMGTGLGLAIVKKLLKLMKGTIDVESEVNVGSTFTFTLPLNYE